jgi:hypothetical protein
VDRRRKQLGERGRPGIQQGLLLHERDGGLDRKAWGGRTWAPGRSHRVPGAGLGRSLDAFSAVQGADGLGGLAAVAGRYLPG